MKKKKLIFTFILFGVVGFVIGNTFLASYKTANENTSKIERILNDNCDCDTIEKSMYAKGVQYSDKQGFSTEKVEFLLTNCKYEHLDEESKRIAKLLNEDGIKDFNLITLEFISKDKQQTITIKNGKIQ